MNQEEQASFPEFSNRKQPQKERLLQSPPKQQSDEQKKKQLIERLMKNKVGPKVQDSEEEQFTCFICHEYFLKPVTTKCGHSFCDFCLQEYFLFSKECPKCHKHIRGSIFTYNNALNQFIDGFIRQNHKDYLEFYQQRLQKYKKWKQQDKTLPTFKAGMTLDVRDQNYVWCKGTVIRIISRIGDPIKFLKIQYKTQNMNLKEEQIRWTNQRVAPAGFYTDRKQIPKYKDLLQTQNKKK